MPYQHLTDETNWKVGVTLLGKVGKPGSKPILHGNGRTSLQFTVIIPSGKPWDRRVEEVNTIIYWRCRWFDPDLLLKTNDVVRVTGIMNKVQGNPALLVNKVELLARWVKGPREPESAPEE